MALPKQVEDQLKQIEDIERQLAGDPQPEPEPAPEPEPTAQPPAPEPEVKPEPKPRETSEVPEETWQQKYRTLKGMYDAEVPRLHAQVKELNAAMGQLKQQLEQRPTAAPAPSHPAPTSLVTEDDVEAFGKDLIEVQRKVAREVAMELKADMDALRTENENLRSKILETGAQVGEVSFEQRLFNRVPNWNTLNNDPKWISWLDEFDPMIRGPRRAAAQYAYNNGDAEGVAYYVDLFNSQNVAPQVDQRQAELERQIQPTRTAAAQTPVSQKGKMYTTRDVERMFVRVKDLNVAHKYEEARQLEAEIDAAYMEGRVTA